MRAEESEAFVLAGFGNEKQSLSYLPGTIHSLCDYYSTFKTSEGNDISMGPFILGTSRSSRGDSGKNNSVLLIKNKTLGGGCWSARGLIGINVACTTMPSQYHHLAISEAAIFSPKNIISPAYRFKEEYLVCILKKLFNNILFRRNSKRNATLIKWYLLQKRNLTVWPNMKELVVLMEIYTKVVCTSNKNHIFPILF